MAQLPELPGVLSADQVAATGAAIAAMQEPSGALPWFPGGKTDPWDHVESAMALSITGHLDEAVAAYRWSAQTQRPDGAWPIEFQQGRVVDPNVDSNFCAYIAVGVWHHYLVTGDTDFLAELWPTVRTGIDLVLRFARDDGAFRWAADGTSLEMFDEALLTGNASILQSLDCAVRIAEVMSDASAVSRWSAAQAKLGRAFASAYSDVLGAPLGVRPGVFEPPSSHSMDWYYPVLGGGVRGEVAGELIDLRWDEFVVPGKGIRCIDHRPWVTGAETSELAIALEALGRVDEASTLVDDIGHLRDPDGSYWTGLVFADGKRWPVEKSCWTSAAVLLAVDAISRATPGNGVFRDVRQSVVVP
ncbi:MAG: prenyltransferase [Gordonia sp. (in: high G+C Gram-positive bacteria)]|uniref:alpha-L-rhamnosidase-related protein n=1 Tax=Gordonia sp. (in: high G+C Gram-positive bacteria) TaxID=84139 RepID=UPI0039E669D0